MRATTALKWPLALLVAVSLALGGVFAEAQGGKDKGKGKAGKDPAAKVKDKGKAGDKGKDKGKGKIGDKDKGKAKDKDKDKGKPGDKGKDKDKGEPGDKGKGLALGKDKEPGEGLALGKDKEPGEAEAPPNGAIPAVNLVAKQIIAGLDRRGKVAKEQAKHLRRIAKIGRIQVLGAKSGNAALIEKAKVLRQKEQQRHDKAMQRLRGAKKGPGKGGAR